MFRIYCDWMWCFNPFLFQGGTRKRCLSGLGDIQTDGEGRGHVNVIENIPYSNVIPRVKIKIKIVPEVEAKLKKEEKNKEVKKM